MLAAIRLDDELQVSLTMQQPTPSHSCRKIVCLPDWRDHRMGIARCLLLTFDLESPALFASTQPTEEG